MFEDFARDLEQLAALPPLPSGWNRYWSAAPELPEVAARFNRACFHMPRWYAEGRELPQAIRRRVSEVWRERPDLRRLLDPLVNHYPCDEFKRPFLRNAEKGDCGYYGDWFRIYPDLKGHLRSFVTARARRFNQSFSSVAACLLWARYYDGGDEAWRMLACVIKRDDRGGSNSYLRHDLETHGTITCEEADRINRFLAELGSELLEHWR